MSGTDLRAINTALDKSGSGALKQLLAWSASIGIPATFAIIMLLQTNAALNRLTECIVKLTVVVESKR